MSVMWFYQVSKEEFGPVSTGQIHKLIDEGTLKPRDQVREDGKRRWIIVAAFLDQVGPPELEFADLSDISFGSNDVPASPPVATAPAETTADDDESDSELQCFCESLGQVLGPMGIHELIRLADVGTLGESDRVRFGDHGDWVLPMDIPELAAAIFSADFGSSSVDDSDADQALADQPLDEADSSQGDSSEAGTDSDAAESSDTTDSNDAPSPKARAKKTDGSKNAAGRPTKKKSKSAGRKRKKKSSKDALLEEIFSEVFTADGKLKTDEERGIAPTGASADLAGLAASAPLGAGAAPAPGSPQPYTPPPGQQSPSAAASNMRSAYESAAAARSPSKSKSKSSGFSMPDTKVLGMVAGGIVAVGLLYLLFGLVVGSDHRGSLRAAASDYQKVSNGLTKEKWKEFGNQYKPVMRQIVQSMAAVMAHSPTEKDRSTQKAAITFVKLMNHKVEDIEKRNTVFAEFREILGKD